MSFLPNFNFDTNVLSCPDNWPYSYSPGANNIFIGYAQLANINPEIPGQHGVYDPVEAARTIAATLDDDPAKALWADRVHWQDGPYGGPQIWPDWWTSSHPFGSFDKNPGVGPEGRWVVNLSGTASWDSFSLPDTDSIAKRRKVLLGAGSGYFVAY